MTQYPVMMNNDDDMKQYLTCALGLTLAVILFHSCDRSPVGLEMSPRPVHATIAAPMSGDAPAVKSLSPEMQFAFAEGDFISVCSASSATYMNYELIPDPSNPKSADFRPSAYLLNDGTYYSVYPMQNCAKGPEKISVSFDGQIQAENGSTEHLSAYDYSRAEAVISSNTGEFAFSHAVSWLVMKINVTEAASITRVTISADNGVARSAIMDILTNQVTLSKSSGDCIILKLGGEDGIAVPADGVLTAYATIPADTYTNMKLVAEDASGHKYIKEYSGDKIREAGKYYSPTLSRTDIPEVTAFTAITAFGLYTATDTDNPSALRTYDEDNDQMSFSTDSDCRKFRIFNVRQNDYAIVTVSPADITVGESYTVTEDINGTQRTGTLKAVNKTAGCVWLENKQDKNGYIISIE